MIGFGDKSLHSLDMRLAEKLSMLADQHRVGQRELAEVAGVSIGTMNRVLNGQAKPLRLDEAARLADFFGVSVSYLADDALDEPPAAELADDERTVLEVYRALKLDPQAAIRGLMVAAREEPADGAAPPPRAGEVQLEVRGEGTRARKKKSG